MELALGIIVFWVVIIELVTYLLIRSFINGVAERRKREFLEKWED